MKKLKDWKGDFGSFCKPGDEIDYAIFDYFLGTVPPLLSHAKGYLMGEPYDHDAVGRTRYMAFYQVEGKYFYAGLMTIPQWECYCMGFIGRLSATGSWITEESSNLDTLYYQHKFRNSDWLHYATPEDSSHFGIWMNDVTLQTFTFVEGDEITVHCINKRAFNKEFHHINKFYKGACYV